MLKDVYKEQILKLIYFLNKDIKQKEKKIETLEKKNKVYKDKIKSLNENAHSNLLKLQENVKEKENLKNNLKDISTVTEKKVVELEDKLATKDKEVKKYEDKIKTLKKYNLIIWVLLFVILIMQIYLYTK